MTTQKQSKINAELIASIVQEARDRFGKDKSGLSKNMKTANEIKLSTQEKDYITSDDIKKFWVPLTGIVGVPFGRIVQIAGKADAGKSTMAMLFQKAAQQSDTIVVLWDAEGKFDSSRFKDRMGGEPSLIPVATSRNIVDGTRQVVSYVKAIKEAYPKQKILIVWDSVGASINSAEDEENDDYSKQPGVTAKEISWSIRRFNQLMEKYIDQETGEYTIAILCINQVYANIGSVGNKQKGGGEIEYLSSIILELSRKGNLTKTRNGQKVKFGITSRARVAKNHLFGGEDCLAELDIAVSASGIDLSADVKKNKEIEADED